MSIQVDTADNVGPTFGCDVLQGRRSRRAPILCRAAQKAESVQPRYADIFHVSAAPKLAEDQPERLQMRDDIYLMRPKFREAVRTNAG
jgi:hypothetical protein